MNYYLRLLIEAFFVGIVCLIIGIVTHIATINIVKKLKVNINNDYIVYITLFVSGVLAHILFDLFGGNKWYCKHGMACQ